MGKTAHDALNHCESIITEKVSLFRSMLYSKHATVATSTAQPRDHDEKKKPVRYMTWRCVLVIVNVIVEKQMMH